MNSSPSSRRIRLSLAATILTIGILAGAGCGKDMTTTTTSPDTGPGGDAITTTSAGSQDDTAVGTVDRPRPPLPPGPDVSSGVDTDELVIVGAGDGDYVISRITEAGGTVVEESSLEMLRVRFDVASLVALLDIRDQLREAGVDASVIAVLDPDDIGDGSPEDPA